MLSFLTEDASAAEVAAGSQTASTIRAQAQLGPGGSQDLLKRAWSAVWSSSALRAVQRNAHAAARTDPDAVAAVSVVVQALRARLLLLDDDEFFHE